MKPYVLLIGYRQSLARALHRMGIGYSVWSEKPLKAVPQGVDRVIVAAFPISAIEEDGIEFSLLPTHVIAGTEAAVFPAAALRRRFGARRSPDSLLIRCTDKAAMKNYLRSFDIPMTRYIEHTDALQPQELVDRLGLPVVVKKKRGSGGRDIVIARSIAEVGQNMHPDCLYEAFIDAPEGSIESIIDEGQILFSNITDYHEKQFCNLVPARFTPPQTAQIEALNRKVITALRIRWGLTHLEYYRTTEGILFGEIALRPPGGYIMKLIEVAYDFDPWQSLIEVELGLRPTALPAAPARFAGCLIFHPGAGTINQVARPTTEDCPTMIRCTLKAKIGDRVDSRKGVGEDLGYCIFAHGQHEHVVNDIRRLQADPPVRTR